MIKEDWIIILMKYDNIIMKRDFCQIFGLG